VSISLEVIFGLLLTAVPFVPLCALNAAILHTLIGGSSKLLQQVKTPNQQLIRREFTLTMFAVSASFILLNIPYFIVWVSE